MKVKKFFFFILAFSGASYMLFKTVSAIVTPFSFFEARSAKISRLDDFKWKLMINSLERASVQYPGYVGIYLKDLGTGRIWEYKADRLFPSASLVKVPITAAVFNKIKEKELSLDTQIKLTNKYRRGGSGTLKWAREGTSLSVLELIYRMITDSDNTAAQMIVDHIGMDYLQKSFRNMGLEKTNICQDGMSLASGGVLRENYTTPREMALFFEKIYRDELVDRTSSELLLDFLKHNKSSTRLRKGLPIGWELGHKTGLLRRACHDVGIVFSPSGDYLIAILTADVPNYRSAKKFISNVAKLTYKYYRIDNTLTEADSSSPRKSL
ncbi:MAG: serine hydrolase [Elusimicrobia bacterium]|nr:serine hydrolase [Elusimicrobiota bacterium]